MATPTVRRAGCLNLERKGDHVYTPDSAALSITGDIDLRACVHVANWYSPVSEPGSGNQTFVNKWKNSANQKSYWFGLLPNSGLKPSYSWSTTGANSTSATATAPLPVTPGKYIWIRVIHDVNVGGSTNEVKFYYNATNDQYTMPTSWTQLGNTVSNSGTTSIYDSTAPVRIGSDDGTAQFRGKIWAIQIRNGIDGTIVADINFHTGSR